VVWDIFCTIIDNYGDIGVTWRLARQLADEHAVQPRLWVDDLAAFQRIRPEVNPELGFQHRAGVEIRKWSDPLPSVTPGEVVIEALACNLPEDFIHRMAAQAPQPVWLNLEYLTAEAWADGVHGLPSPHPRLPLVKHFFVPGFSPQTGGLTREAGLMATRRAFQASPQAQADFWHSLHLPSPTKGERRLSLFSYENAAIPGLITLLSQSPTPITLLVPQGKALPQISQGLAGVALGPGTRASLGALTVHVLPMLDQDTDDRLLWACERNFVRGEDSFLRAQYAARPMVWQAYRQEDRAHFAKVGAFLDRYCADAPEQLAGDIRSLTLAWNEEADIQALWHPVWNLLDAHTQHARQWCDALESMPDLASKLMIFCEKVIKTR